MALPIDFYYPMLLLRNLIPFDLDSNVPLYVTFFPIHSLEAFCIFFIFLVLRNFMTMCLGMNFPSSPFSWKIMDLSNLETLVS